MRAIPTPFSLGRALESEGLQTAGAGRTVTADPPTPTDAVSPGSPGWGWDLTVVGTSGSEYSFIWKILILDCKWVYTCFLRKY